MNGQVDIFVFYTRSASLTYMRDGDSKKKRCNWT